MSSKLVSVLWILATILASAAAALTEDLTPGHRHCVCETNAPPVCGSDGRLYPSACLLDCTNVIMKTKIRIVEDEFCKLNHYPCVKKIDSIFRNDGRFDKMALRNQKEKDIKGVKKPSKVALGATHVGRKVSSHRTKEQNHKISRRAPDSSGYGGPHSVPGKSIEDSLIAWLKKERSRTGYRNNKKET